jgi:hypothetical protein
MEKRCKDLLPGAYATVKILKLGSQILLRLAYRNFIDAFGTLSRLTA